MSRLVVDASVLIKLFIPENGSQEAIKALKQSRQLFAPDLVLAECGNVLWKCVRRGDLSEQNAGRILSDIMQMPIRLLPTHDLIVQAFAIATQSDRTVYDCLYIAAAIHTKAVMLTADRRLVEAMAGSGYEPFLQALQA